MDMDDNDDFVKKRKSPNEEVRILMNESKLMDLKDNTLSSDVDSIKRNKVNSQNEEDTPTFSNLLNGLHKPKKKMHTGFLSFLSHHLISSEFNSPSSTTQSLTKNITTNSKVLDILPFFVIFKISTKFLPEFNQNYTGFVCFDIKLR